MVASSMHFNDAISYDLQRFELFNDQCFRGVGDAVPLHRNRNC